MNIYHYDPLTFEFLSVSQAVADPLEDDRFLIPAFATSVAVTLSDEPGFTICFNSDIGVWEHVEDHRGKTIYSTSTKEESVVDFLGCIPVGFSLVKPSEFDLWVDGAWVEDKQAKADKLASEYKHMRRAEYPPMEDYLDGVVKGDQAQIDKYIADCQAVKAKYPKP